MARIFLFHSARPMSNTFNAVHVLVLIIAFPLTHAELPAIAQRDIVAALIFNLSLIIASSAISLCSDRLAQAKRLGLWICYAVLTPPIVYVCAVMAGKPQITVLQVVAVALGYAIMPLLYLGHLSLEGFLAYLED